MYEIISKTEDMAGRWMVRVAINNDSSIFLKFDSDPTQGEVDAAVDSYQLSQATVEVAEA